MRGSVYYQTSLLAKCVFAPSAKKWMRTDKDHPHYQKVASYKTLETYRRIWDDLGNFVRRGFNINDFESLSAGHIETFMMTKIERRLSKQYLEKISAALGKLEVALRHFSYEVSGRHVYYDFSIRQRVLDDARDAGLLYQGYHDRAYADPEAIIKHLSSSIHQHVARIQLFGGARMEGIGLIKPSQLKGVMEDPVTGKQVYCLETKEKGGKSGDVYLRQEEYDFLERHLPSLKSIKIDQEAYARDIRSTCHLLGIRSEGSHGFRWSFAQRRFLEYQRHGYTYEQARQGLSLEMKHNRPSISDHYTYGR